MRRRAGAAWAAALAVALGGLGVALPMLDPEPASPLRHVWAVPVILAAIRFGAVGGVLAALGAVMLQTPHVLAHLEDAGVSAVAIDDVVTAVTLLGLGALLGAFAGEARRQRVRGDTLLAAQRALADEAPLRLALGRVRAALLARVQASDLALVVRDGDTLVVAGGDAPAPGSAAHVALTTGAPVFVANATRELRPLRVIAVPLRARDETVGALALERRGELGARERLAIAELGVHLGLALENARLLSCQRRFTEELAEKVAAATRHLEAADRAKTAFISIASHELRTPLTALFGFSELLALRPMAADEVRRLAGVMRRETERLTRIVDDLLDLSRLERGLTPRLTRRAVDVVAALAAVVEVFSAVAPRRRFALEWDERLPEAYADPDALDRIVKNLVANAVKYSSPDGTVRLAARAAARAVEISVSDDGPGIPPDALPHVFEPYYRAPGASATASGLGLGLAVVKALVEAHGGAIRVDSHAGRGTRVTFSVPPVA